LKTPNEIAKKLNVFEQFAKSISFLFANTPFDSHQVLKTEVPRIGSTTKVRLYPFLPLLHSGEVPYRYFKQNGEIFRLDPERRT
jgi:hypothetical protein